MSYKIEKRLFNWTKQIPLTSKKYVVAHESGNPANVGLDSLEKEIAYMNRTRGVFVSHWVGAGGKIVQTAPTGYVQYGAGKPANYTSVAHVELARTNNKETFKKDYAAYIWLLRKLADDYGLPCALDQGRAGAKGIKTHAWVTQNLGNTTHMDPYSYLASFGITKAQFAKDVVNGIDTNSISTQYYDYTPDYVKTLTDVGLYSDKELKHEIKRYKKGTKLTITGIAFDGEIPRLKTNKGYISANRKYVKGHHDTIGTVKVLVDDLNYYSTARWSSPNGVVDKGTVLTVKKKVDVDGRDMYLLKAGNYITAATKYVQFTHKVD